jgi:signal-transduction protein with cAMP-binding, CBS, and nucleotidyltransferase domain
MGYKAGETVIVTQEDVHHVGVVLDKYTLSKATVYDVLLENRTALIMLNTAVSKKTFINKVLTAKLCATDLIQTTIPYKDMVLNDLLPICRA